MDKFIYLFRGGARLNASAEEYKDRMQLWFNWVQSLQQGGSYVVGDPLHKSGKVLSGANKIITDGPFTEAKEIIGGYIIVNANDINHAVEISQGCPIFDEGGSMEVR